MIEKRSKSKRRRARRAQALSRARSLRIAFALPAVAYHPLDPPLRFSLLCSSYSQTSPLHSLYRGSLPKPRNYAFLSSLHLKTVISLTPKSLDHYAGEGLLPARKRRRIGGVGEELEDEEAWEAWRNREGVKVIHVKVGKAKDGAIPFSPTTVKEVLELLIAKENYPIYMHDLDGSDVLSIMTAALRKLQGWSERAWLEEMSRFLRQPPPEPEHLTFLRRIFSPAHPCPTSPPPAAPLSITIPPPSRRVEWLWKGGMPTAALLGIGTNGKKSTSKETANQHTTMRCKVEEDPLPAPLPSCALEEDGESGEGGLWEGASKLDQVSKEHHKERNEALSVSRQRSVTPGTASRMVMGIGFPPSSATTSTAVSRSHSLAGSPRNDSSFAADSVLSTSAGTNDLSGGDLSDLSAAESGEGEGYEEEEDGEGYEDEDEEDEDEGYDDDEVHPLSQTIDALDLGL